MAKNTTAKGAVRRKKAAPSLPAAGGETVDKKVTGRFDAVEPLGKEE